MALQQSQLQFLHLLIHTAILALMSFHVCHAACPTDTVALWAGYNIHHGKEVMMYVYRPAESNGLSTIVCPGGSYHWLDETTEGQDVGEWLASNGITAFVLFYRTAGISGHLVMSAACFHSSNFLKPAGIDTDANLCPSYVAARHTSQEKK